MTYGNNIGRKFDEDGTARQFHGNTVVADVTPGCSAYDVMVRLHRMVVEAGFDRHLILLPEDSYHMTVIRGVNDQVRTDTHWPEKLPKDTPMEQVDDYMTAAITSVKMPEGVLMKFDRIQFNENTLVVLLIPADEEQDRILRDYRDKVATAIGLFLPRHHAYRFHITLGYTRIVPEGEDAVRQKELVEAMDRYIADRPAFEITAPYMAYYKDMLAFSPTRLPRT